MVALTLVALALGLSCAGRRRPPPNAPPGATMGVYRAATESADGERRTFRLLLFAEPPDRLHGEILSPVGTTEVIVDGGGGRLAVTLPADRVVYAGRADRRTMAKLIGVGLSLPELVAALWEGELEGDWTLEREPVGRPGLPDRLELQGEGHVFQLWLKRIQPLRTRTPELGTGVPPEGMESRPLEQLPLDRAGTPEPGDPR